MWCRFDGNEWLYNIRCVMLNYYDLGLLQVGLKSFVILVDYWDYMGSSLGTWLLVDRFFTWTLIIWLVLWQLVLEQVQHYICSVWVFENKRVFKIKLWESGLKLCQWSNPPCPYKDYRWLFKYWLGGFYFMHLRQYSGMDMWWPYYATLWSNGRGSLHMWISHICR